MFFLCGLYWPILVYIYLNICASVSLQLWVLWELVMVGEPVLVMAPNVGISSAIILGMVWRNNNSISLCVNGVLTPHYLNLH